MTDLQLRRLVLDACDGPFGSAIKSEHYVDNGPRVIRLGNIGIGEWRDSDKAFLTEDHWCQLSSHHAHPGDVVMAGLGDERNPVGRSCVVPDYVGDALVKADCYRFRVDRNRIDVHYLSAFLSSRAGLGQSASLSDGATRQRLTLSKALSLRVPYLPLDAQRRIADFLDGETARIDALIAKKRQLVTLIHERSSRRILDAVRGVDIVGHRKSTALRWLGNVPNNWPVVSVGSQFEVLLGKMLDERRISGDHLRPYIRNTNVQWDRIDTTDLAQMDFAPHERDRFRVLPGDLLVCEGGEPGRAAVWQGDIEEIYYQKALHRCRTRGRSSARWLFYCLRAATDLNVFAVEGNVTTIAHLTGEQFRAQKLPFPDPDVQLRIVDQLDTAGQRDRLILDRLYRQIGLLNEHRQALITAAVTGELEVPGV